MWQHAASDFTARFRQYGEEHKNDLVRTGFGSHRALSKTAFPNKAKGRAPSNARPFPFLWQHRKADTSRLDHFVPHRVSVDMISDRAANHIDKMEHFVR